MVLSIHFTVAVVCLLSILNSAARIAAGARIIARSGAAALTTNKTKTTNAMGETSLSFCPKCKYKPNKMKGVSCMERAEYFVKRYRLPKERAIANVVEKDPSNCLSSSAISATSDPVRQASTTLLPGKPRSGKSAPLGGTENTEAARRRSSVVLPRKPRNSKSSAPIDGTKLAEGHAVLQLSGEFGNHLGKFASYRAIQTIARREFNLDLKLHLRGQGSKKSPRPARDCKKCMLNMKDMSFTECNNAVYDDLAAKQKRVFNEYGLNRKILTITDANVTKVRDSLSFYAEILQNKDIMSTIGKNTSNHMGLSLPFLFIEKEASVEMVDAFSDEIRDYFAFNDDCCKKLPDSNETVFHYRGFDVEIPNRAHRGGFAELGPNRSASELLGHLQPGSKVAILSRFKGRHPEKYRNAMESRGLSVRIVDGQSGPEDFCFLMRAQTLYGTYRSTYARWATYLSSTLKHATLYTMDYRNTNRPKDGVYEFTTYPWRDKVLKRIIHLPVFVGDS